MRHYKLLVIVLSFVSFRLLGQTVDVDSLQTDTLPFLSVTNLHPSVLQKNKWLLAMNARFPRYYKMYNGMTGTIDKLSDMVVINEAYFNFYGLYGLSKKMDISVTLPVNDIHHYSPMSFVSGKGLGDIRTGIIYSLVTADSSKSSLTAGLQGNN